MAKAVRLLAELVGVPESEARALGGHPEPIDAVVNIRDLTFVMEWKGSSGVAEVARAVRQVQHYVKARRGNAVPLVVVPFMGPVGREYCREHRVNWIDLSGNASINAPGIRVRVEGRPNRFKKPGRPSSAFAPKSSRIARWLLLHPGAPMTQREIARATDMDEGFTSRIVARLEDDGLIVREPDGAIRARDPDLLLDAWREDYDFSKHQIVKGHVAARSEEALLHRISEQLRSLEADHAATGMAAAWQFTHYAGFRIVATYVADLPSLEVLDHLGFREEAAGANVWLVIPADAGVFHGASEHGGVRCVHPVQAYLDLKEHPERADEAAAHLRAELLTWSADA